MDMTTFLHFFQNKIRKSTQGGALLFHHAKPEYAPQDRAIHVHAESGWTLTGEAILNGKAASFWIPFPAGHYTFDFPPGSANLTAIIIDPDPGSGEGPQVQNI